MTVFFDNPLWDAENFAVIRTFIQSSVAVANSHLTNPIYADK